MSRPSRTVLAFVVALGLVAGGFGGGWFAARTTRSPDPLAWATLTLPSSGVELPQRFDGSADPCPDYAISSPATSPGTTADARGFVWAHGSMHVLCQGATSVFGGADALADARVDQGPDADKPLTQQPVRVQGPFGTAVRLDTALGEDQVLSEWFVERDGTVLAIGYLHDPAAADWPTVDAVLGSFAWR